MLRSFAITATLGLATLASADTAMPTDNVTQFVLDNGLEVVVIEDHRAPAVTHMLWYRVGAADEPPGQSGIAHYLEHLMFKGTDTAAPGEFSDVVSRNGGNDNAFTSWDYTGYFQRVAADRLELMMQYEADRMANLRIAEEDAAPELQVVLEERAQRVDSDPGALFREQKRAAMFLNHPYGHPIIGWRHEVAELDVAAANAFYDLHYAPNNAVLVVAGDTTPEAVRDLAEVHYGPIPANDAIADRARPAEPPQLAERRVMFSDPRITQPYLSRSYIVPERDPGAQEDAAALTYLADLLGGDAATSYLGRALQFDTQTALFTGAYYSGTFLDDGIFTLVVAPTPEVSLADAEAALDEAVAAFAGGDLDSETFERLKRQYEASYIYSLDSADGLARRYGAALTSGLTVEDVQAWPQIIQDVTEDDVIAAAQRLLDTSAAVTGYAEPAGSAAPEVTQ